MNPEASVDRLAELERACLQALALPPEERGAYLASACGDDEAMRREVESLLAAESEAARIFPTHFSRHAGEVERDLSDALAEYGTTGVFEIQEKLGEGGMGLVFRARQSAPVVREVALKIIHPDMASKRLVSRFLMERQAQAMMDHPGIARVLDAGETSRGLPYLAMELVTGQTIATYCEEHRLGLRARVELIIQVCQAIQHAHNKGIIHRDIKPSNVLVAVYDGRAVPKVIDFGIAKAIENSRPQCDESTRAGVMLGTFEYMSPEQTETNAADLDTRTDIYSLGALLYLLVCGTTPLYSPTQGQPAEPLGYGEILRRIREEVPVAASRVTGNPAHRELDWILARALDKDRNRRYQSADGMARDLRRYLDGDPLEAGPPSAAYRLRKLAAKYKFWVAAAAALVMLLLVASIALAFALRQQTRANASGAALREVVRRIIIERPAQLAEIPNRTALRGQLMRDAQGALDALSQDAGNDGALQLELARAYLSIGLAKGPYNGMGSEGDPAEAANYVKKSLQLYSVLARKRPNDADLRRGQIEALSTWLHLQYRLVHPEEGEKAARQLQTEIDHMSPELRDKIQARWYLSMGYLELGSILFGLSRESEALELHRKALAAFRDGVPSDWMKDPEKLDHLSHLQREVAISAWMFGGYSPEVESTARMAVMVVDGRSEPNCRMRHAQSEGTLGEIEWASGKRNQGVATMRKSVAEFGSLVAEDPQNAVFANAGAQVRAYLALALAGDAGGAEAVRLAAENLRLSAGADAKLNKGRERLMVYQVVLGAALSGAGRFDEATRKLRDTLARNRDWNANFDLQWSALHLLATALEAQGKYEEASQAGKEALKLAAQSSGPGVHSRVLMAVAARDYAASVAHWKLASPDERTAALHGLNNCCGGLDERYGVLAGALIEWPLKKDDVAAIRNMLSKPEESMGRIRQKR